MVECEYCEAAFEDEASYLAHLRDAHEGELGAIDQRRVEQLESDDGGFPTGPAVLGVVLLIAFAVVLYLTVFSGSGDAGVTTDVPNRGDDAVISQVEQEPAQTARHVQPGTDVDYEKMPPTSGPHYPPGNAVAAGYYQKQQPTGGLVHSLEHGAVVVWYDPTAMNDEAKEHLQAFARNYQRSFGSFIAVPTPVENPDHPFVLTAWEHRLTLDEYDPEAVREFTGEYLGRGPEGAYR